MESWWWLAGSDIGCSVDLERGPSAKLVRPRQCRHHHQGARASQGREGAVGSTMAGLVVSADRWDWTLKNRAGPGLVFSVDGPEPGKKRSITLLAWRPGPGPSPIPFSDRQLVFPLQPALHSANTSSVQERQLSRIVMMHAVKKLLATCRCPLPVSARQTAITYCTRYKPCYGQGRW